MYDLVIRGGTLVDGMRTPRHRADIGVRDGRIAADEYFVAEQNARVVRDAEIYYRAMFRGGAESWNVRDRHMMTTLEGLLDHAGRVIARERLIELSRTRLGDSSDRSVDVLVSRLRRKLSHDGKPAPIVTVRGVGYMLNVAVNRS